MAVEQSGAQAGPDPDQGAPSAAAAKSADAAPADAKQADAEPDFDDLKRKFREALERKHDTHATAQGAQDGSKVHGSRGPAVSRRSFRRKSGG